MSRRLLVVGSILVVVGSGGLILWFGSSDAPEYEQDVEAFQVYRAGEGEDAQERESRSGDSAPASGDENADAVGEGKAAGGNDEPVANRRVDGSPPQPAESLKERELSGEAKTEEAGSDDKGESADLTREQVQEGIEAFRPVARRCYEKTRETFPEAEGRIVLEFSIESSGDDGRVFMSEAGDDTTLFETDLHDCLLYNISEVKFDAPGNEGVVNVTYPLQFAAQ